MRLPESYQPVNTQAARQCLRVCQTYAEHWPARKAQGCGLVLSNLAPTELADCIGESVMDRMQECGGGTLAFTWGSYRQRKGQCV
nr:hypothetical protein [Candidatus Hamiltonella defensa]